MFSTVNNAMTSGGQWLLCLVIGAMVCPIITSRLNGCDKLRGAVACLPSDCANSSAGSNHVWLVWRAITAMSRKGQWLLDEWWRAAFWSKERFLSDWDWERPFLSWRVITEWLKISCRMQDFFLCVLLQLALLFYGESVRVRNAWLWVTSEWLRLITEWLRVISE